MRYFINFLIEIQNKILNEKTSKNANKLVSGVSLCLNAQTQKKRENIEEEIKKILKLNEYNPEKLIKYIENCGTKVYRFNNAQKIMNRISQEIGFIPQTRAIKAILINLILSHCTNTHFNIITSTENMFVLETKEIDTMWFIQQFYKWYSMKHGMKGFDIETQECFNSFIFNNSSSKIKNLSIDEIFNLKDAIARDIDSINFAIELTKSTVEAKKALSKLTSGGASI